MCSVVSTVTRLMVVLACPVQDPARPEGPGRSRGPQSAVSAVGRRAASSDDSDGESAGGRRRAVASTVRVTDRPRPPAHLLPRPDILVRAMKEARRSTSGGAPAADSTHSRSTDGPGQRPPAAAGAKVTGPARADRCRARHHARAGCGDCSLVRVGPHPQPLSVVSPLF